MQTRLEPGTAPHSFVLVLSGDVILDSAADVYAELSALSQRRELEQLTVDFGAVGRLDSAGAVAATMGRQRFEAAHKRLELRGLTEQHSAALSLIRERRPASQATPDVRPRARWITKTLPLLGEVAEVVVDTLTSGLRSLAARDRRRRSAIAEQTVLLGVDAWFIVAVLSFLIGVILAFQGAFQLRKFGADVYMAELVGLGMVREFAPFITAVVLAGRSGAAMAAEIGSMTVNEEVDALRSMGIAPAQFLVLPRVAGITIAQPLLTVLSMAVGITAGIATGGLVGVQPWVAFERMQDALVLEDFVLGLIKSVLFAWIIGFVGCFQGLATRGGAQSVGKNTTSAVVISIFLIVVTDSIVTTAWTLSHGPSRL